jgi:hypothetical protein
MRLRDPAMFFPDGRFERPSSNSFGMPAVKLTCEFVSITVKNGFSFALQWLPA